MGKKALNLIKVVSGITSSILHQRFKLQFGAARPVLGISVIAITALLSSCSTPTPIATNPLPQIVASSTPVPTIAPSPTIAPNPTITPTPIVTPAGTSTPQQTAEPVSLDPCQLITSQEASTLTGATFGEGMGKTLPGGGKTCTYGSQTTNIFFVEVVQAPDEATAEAAQTQFLADLQTNLQQLTSEGFKVNQVPNFADGAVTAQVNVNAGGMNVSGSAFAFRKGTIFVGFSDVAVGGAAPSSDAMQSEATTVLGRLP